MSDAVRPATHPLQPLVRAIEHDTGIDRRAAVVDRAATPLAASAMGPLLRGQHIGHALHPLLTDIPIGCWTSAMLLDLLGGRSSGTAARRLTGLGLLAVVPTVMSGLVEFDAVEDQPTRRVATAHAVGNSVAAGCQLLSWRARRKDRRVRGALWGLAGNSVATAAGYLGGHMAFGRGTGDGERAMAAPQDSTPTSHDVARTEATQGQDLLDGTEAAQLLGVTPDRLDELVEQGLLPTANADEPGVRWFRHSDVDAVRLVGS